ncbi:MAG: hypothetical protein CM1200mP24_03580 [Gammaproteobacteria bacterium]|nr:MAG: hypothetical protein CM1200mP24_03580 [Gammaproteobacteria bacterium]
MVYPFVSPLPFAVSRGDQLENAALMQHKGLSMVRQEEGLTPSEFVKCVQELLKGKVINPTHWVSFLFLIRQAKYLES